MACALIDTATGKWLSGPHDEAPPIEEGQALVTIPGSFTNGLTIWSAEARGFIDKPHPEPTLEHQVASLVRRVAALEARS